VWMVEDVKSFSSALKLLTSSTIRIGAEVAVAACNSTRPTRTLKRSPRRAAALAVANATFNSHCNCSSDIARSLFLVGFPRGWTSQFQLRGSDSRLLLQYKVLKRNYQFTLWVLRSKT